MANYSPRLLALFQKRIEGDDSLLSLARLKFEKCLMGAEMYAENIDELNWLFGFKPQSQSPVVVHLPRCIDIQQDLDIQAILDFARAFENRVYGYVVHDTKALVDNFDQYVWAVRELDSQLNTMENRPYLFIEYAAGVELQSFIDLFITIKDLQLTSACIDIGHIGIWQIRKTYRQRHYDQDICALHPAQPELYHLMDDIEYAVNSGLKAVLYCVRALGILKKPTHFHLHDGHPLSTVSPYGVSDHLSFFQEIPIPFEYRGSRVVRPMFQPNGLKQIIRQALASFPSHAMSFTLEIHPSWDKIPLHNVGWLFEHWIDKTNAELMNAWLLTLCRNFDLLEQAVAEATLR